MMAGPLGFGSVHALTNNTSICAALVGAIGAGYLDLEGTRRLQVTAFPTPEEVGPLAPTEEAVALIFGGQATPEVNCALTKNALKSLAQGNYGGAIFFHLRVWTRASWPRRPRRTPRWPTTWRARRTPTR
ncbi:hypothetical protein [Thermus tengchongensis]|uniref:hypothetical protein n=1 Tax=Thermus tengchongensis TaxID=1214928 RepID=UPI00197DCDE7|nr:hypothetical protein [Thermus tengchongensis]